MLSSDGHAAVAGVDAVALKPAEHDWRRIADLHEGVATVTVDYEGHDHVPDLDALGALAARDGGPEVRLTTPVRADGFDPLGDDSLAAAIPESVGRVVVAGHPSYLSEAEADRAVAPRFGAAVDADADAWVGTEGVERAALATGATQFELLARDTERSVRALRAAGFEGGVAVYAPTVLSDDEDEILDAVGGYVARRQRVQRALSDSAVTDGGAAGASGVATGAGASGRVREVLSAAARDYALVGDESAVEKRVGALREAGVDRVVAYPAAGLESFCGPTRS